MAKKLIARANIFFIANSATVTIYILLPRFIMCKAARTSSCTPYSIGCIVLLFALDCFFFVASGVYVSLDCGAANTTSNFDFKAQLYFWFGFVGLAVLSVGLGCVGATHKFASSPELDIKHMRMWQVLLICMSISYFVAGLVPSQMYRIDIVCDSQSRPILALIVVMCALSATMAYFAGVWTGRIHRSQPHAISV